MSILSLGLVLICAFAASLIGTPLAAWIGRRVGVLDRPGDLAIHTRAVPRTGGLAILAAFGLALAVSQRLGLWAAGDLGLTQGAGILIGLGLIAVSGLLDDIRSITPIRKLLAQFFAAAVAVGCGVQVGLISLPGIAFAFTIFYLVGGANALNLLDGMNGLAGGVAAIAALALAGLAALQGSPTLVLLALVLAGAAAGFLPYNFPKARLFMGDVGSLSLGFVLAALAALLARGAGDVSAFAAGLVAIALPVVDTGLAIMRRLGRRGDVFSGDREHVYDLLARRGLGPTRTVWVMYAVAAALGGLSLAIYRLPALPGVGLAVACFLALAAGAIRLGALGKDDEAGPVSGPRRLRQALTAAARRYTHVLFFDILVVVLAFYGGLFLRFVDESPAARAEFVPYLRSTTVVMPFVVVAFIFANAVIGLYNRWWAYASSRDAVPIVAAGSLGGIIVSLADILWGATRPIPLGVVFIGTAFSIGGFGLFRYRRRLLEELSARRHRPGIAPQRAVIVGAGESGQQLAWKMQHDAQGRYAPVAFVDDDARKHGLRIHGVPVQRGTDHLREVVTECKADIVVLMPDDILQDHPADGSRRWQTLVDQALATQARVHILPGAVSRLQADNDLAALRALRPEDLLPREAHHFDQTASRDLVQGQTVLVTGAAGSIGSELCRQMVQLGAGCVILLDNNETGLFDLQLDLGDTGAVRTVAVVGDVTDRSKIKCVMETHRPQLVFHAAAYKHVPLMECYPEEAVRVNVGGTQVMAELAARFDVDRFVLISSDKAVNPRSVMGATKRIAELIVTRMSAARTRFVAVRFGNVLGSRGSVLPVFERQIACGGPVTITDPEMTRYFMSIPEAVALVIQAATLAEGGEIMVLDLGAQVGIVELAHKVIRMHGLRPEVDIPIKITGPRPGEKTHEELFCAQRSCPVGKPWQPTHVMGILRACNDCAPRFDELASSIARLKQLAFEQRNGQLHQGIQDVLALQGPVARAR